MPRGKVNANVHGLDVRAEAVRVWRIARRLEPSLGRFPKFTVSVSRKHFGTSGRAWACETVRIRHAKNGREIWEVWKTGRIHITAGNDLDDLRSTIAHEIAYHVCFVRFSRDVHHGPEFYAAWSEIMEDAGFRWTRDRENHRQFRKSKRAESREWYEAANPRGK